MALSELGAFLQRHRDERGYTLDEMEEITRIRRAYLEAIESGAWQALPPGVYTRGLLRNYARALGVSHASVMRMYVKERPQEAKLPEPQLISHPLVNEPRFSPELVLAMVIMGVAVVLMVWIARNYVLPAVQDAGLVGPTPTAAVTGAAQTTAGVTPASTRAVAVAGKTGTAAGRSTVAPLATRTPTPTSTPPSGLLVDIKATGNAWLRIFTDGGTKPVFEGFLREGDTWKGQAKERVRLRMGNAGDTRITLNGQTVEPLGKRGDVLTREWRLLPDGNIEQINEPE